MNIDPDTVHLIPAPEHGPNCYVDAVAIARGERSTVYALRPDMTWADFEAELAEAEKQAEAERSQPPRDLAAELDALKIRIAALEARIAKLESAKVDIRK